MSEPTRKDGVETLERTRQREKKEDLWRVVLHNDDYTPMDFVVDVLERIYDKTPAESYRIMMKVHVEGRGIAGIFTHEVAETKARTTVDDAREAGYPLLASVEEV
jgi:ATP-dependent Clp protease adaptor protein ClpS